jgi:hypothetical protein
MTDTIDSIRMSEARCALRRTAWLAVLACALLPALHADDLQVSEQDRQADVAWLESLGLKGAAVLEFPFQPPLSRKSFIAPLSWYRSAATARPELRRREISAGALREDLPILQLVMQKAYGGWDSAEKRGWKWAAFFDDWDKWLEARKGKVVPIVEALDPFRRLLDFQLDNHSGPVELASFQRGSVTVALKQKAAASGCTQAKLSDGGTMELDAGDPGQQPKQAYLPDLSTPVWYLTYPERAGAVTSVRCGAAWIETETAFDPTAEDRKRSILELSQASADAPAFRRISQDLGYFRLPEFSKDNGERLRALLEQLPPSAHAWKAIIFDLRSNTGGDAPIQEMAEWLGSTAMREVDQTAQKVAASCVYDALRWGYTEITMARTAPPISDVLRQRLQWQLDGLNAPPPEGCPRVFEERASSWNYSRHKSPAKVRFIVLVDRRCGSDCERMAYDLAADPGTIIVGANTFGVAEYIQPGYFLLPHSRLPFRIALGRSDLYGDGRSVDGHGLDVDVLLKSEQDQTAEAIVKLAEKLIAR